eukprot:4826923-Alexandrium_andersonii.AAC.1
MPGPLHAARHWVLPWGPSPRGRTSLSVQVSVGWRWSFPMTRQAGGAPPPMGPQGARQRRQGWRRR